MDSAFRARKGAHVWAAIVPVLPYVIVTLFAFAFVPYVINIVRGKVQPEKATWIVWASLDWLALVSMIEQHTTNGQIVAGAIGCSIVLALSFKYGTPGWKLIDKVCIAGGIIAALMWALYGEALLGTEGAMAAILLATWPTLETAWKNPKGESLSAWIFFSIASFLNVAMVKAWILPEYIQPITFAVVDGAVLGVVLSRRLYLALAR